MTTGAYRGIAVVAVLSFLVPPVLFVTEIAYYAVFTHGLSNMFHDPGNWLLLGPLGFALVTSFWAPRSGRIRLAITVTNLLILLCCVLLELALLLGLTRIKG
ncbi:MAG: hypothetical protein C5B58_06410 [Acidobacteria bacterium]|nr:MAG: hypothetical protein C5B58_06410 [Acidobacteriota bacterium]